MNKRSHGVSDTDTIGNLQDVLPPLSCLRLIYFLFFVTSWTLC